MAPVEARRPACMSLMPNEVLALIASQLVLSFEDVISLSSTSRKIRESTAFLVNAPLRIEDLDGRNVSESGTKTTSGLVRSTIINVPFTTWECQSQSEQLRKLLVRTPRLRYLALRRPPLDPTEPISRWEPSRSKTATHPFPLRSSHFQCPGSPYLNDLTHLELCDLSVHPMLLRRLPRLTHLKLSVSGHRDAYLPSEVLNIVSFAKECKLVAFEIGMHAVIAVTEQRERTSVVKACAAAWPELRTLNLFSVGPDGKVPSLSDRWTRPESTTKSAQELANALRPCPHLSHLSLGLASDSHDLSSSERLAKIMHATCPELELFRCLAPAAVKSSRRPFVESYEVINCRRASSGTWTCEKEVNQGAADRIFGMLG